MSSVWASHWNGCSPKRFRWFYTTNSVTESTYNLSLRQSSPCLHLSLAYISDILKSSLQLHSFFICLQSSTQWPLGASLLRICPTLPWYRSPEPPKSYILHTYKINITCSLPPAWATAVSASVCWPQGSTSMGSCLRGSREPLELNLGLLKMEWVSYGCLQDTISIAPM